VLQAQQLMAMGDYVAVHFDASAAKEAFAYIEEHLGNNPSVAFAKTRIKCGWGEWSLVQATLHAVEAAVDSFPRATHFYMVSGDCMAIKSASHAKALLDSDDCDYIESFDFFESDRIKTGMKEERLIYRHFFNERNNKTIFYNSWWAQRKLGLEREILAGLQIMIGSQWWCLRRRTIEWIIDITKTRPDVMKFFRTTWIPDETFFQTLVRHLVPEPEIRTRTLTFLMFTDYGMPVTFYNDHYDLLLSQDFLFARKVSPEATDLKGRLGVLWASERDDFKISDEGRKLFGFLTGRGRIGRLFAPRFWEAEASSGRERELLIVECKKWHVAKRLVGSIKHHTNIPCIDYLFNEDDTDVPDLGGIQTTLSKRTRHRRALMQDFFNDWSTTRLLELECEFSDDYLMGHAKRVGLAGDQTAYETMAQLLPTIRYDVVYESDRIRDAGFENRSRLRELVSPDENTPVIKDFLSVTEDVARGIAQTPYLFAD